MRANETDWSHRLDRQRRTSVGSQLSALRTIAQGEVLAQQLTGSAEWDAFLRVAKGMRDEAEQELGATRDLLERPDLSTDEIRQLQARIGRARTRMDTIDTVLGIPKVLAEQGEQARELIAKYAEAEEN